MREEKSYYVYMVAGRSRVLYVGFTSDLYQRVMQHRAGYVEGFTSQYHCARLVWYERYGEALPAIAREKQIKRWRREKKLFLIELENPTWEDLSADWGLPIEPKLSQRTPTHVSEPLLSRAKPGELLFAYAASVAAGRKVGFSAPRCVLRSK